MQTGLQKREYRGFSPFDNSATSRLMRMGLLGTNGAANVDAVSVVAKVYSGLFYDTLYDFYGDTQFVFTLCHSLMDQLRKESAGNVLLSICLQYDRMHRQLPELIWWLSGNPVLVELFVSGMIVMLNKLISESEVKDT